MQITLTSDLSQWIRSAFENTFPDSDTDFSAVHIVQTANSEFGDYQCNGAMPLAKVMKSSPRAIAQKVLDNITESLPASLDRVEIAGPGFLNMYLKDEWLTDCLTSLNHENRFGVSAAGEGQTVVLDYGGPNITKPLHIGHLRTHNIGSTLDRIYRYLGYNVISDSHLGDWGTQFGITIMGYRNFGDSDAMEKTPLEELERVYVKSYARAKEDEDWMTQCREELVKLQAGDPENLALWKKFIAYSLQEIDRIYKRLGVSFDMVRGESFYQDKLAGMVSELEEKGLAKASEGAIVVFLEEEKLPVCIVRKSDGGFNYATTDIATVKSRIEEFDPDKIVYITDERQQLHFKQLFAICKRLGLETRLDHVWFGLMRMPDAVISTREGNVIKLDALLDEAEMRALDVIKESSAQMTPAKQKEVARAVGIGALKYADLSQNPQTTVTFTWEKALALDGNSGPYLQYAYARIASVRDKYAERFPESDLSNYSLQISHPLERILAVDLLRFSDIVARAANAYKPSIITDYLYDLAQAYSSFYQNVPFLKAEEGIRESRVLLCGLVAGVLREGLKLLGIETPERI